MSRSRFVLRLYDETGQAHMQGITMHIIEPAAFVTRSGRLVDSDRTDRLPLHGLRRQSPGQRICLL